MPAAALAGLIAGLAGPLFLRQGERVTMEGRAVAIDGDSLRMGGTELRLLGIDAPELAQTGSRGAAEVDGGQEARRALAALVAGVAVRCESEAADTYGRRLARGSADGRDIAAAMVLAGHAVNTGNYGAEQGRAREARAGLWRTRFDIPADWRATHPREGEG
ncbi:thermonuclease family protein [Nostoc sp. NIES-2111]